MKVFQTRTALGSIFGNETFMKRTSMESSLKKLVPGSPDRESELLLKALVDEEAIAYFADLQFNNKPLQVCYLLNQHRLEFVILVSTTAS